MSQKATNFPVSPSSKFERTETLRKSTELGHSLSKFLSSSSMRFSLARNCLRIFSRYSPAYLRSSPSFSQRPSEVTIRGSVRDKLRMYSRLKFLSPSRACDFLGGTSGIRHVTPSEKWENWGRKSRTRHARGNPKRFTGNYSVATVVSDGIRSVLGCH